MDTLYLLHDASKMHFFAIAIYRASHTLLHFLEAYVSHIRIHIYFNLTKQQNHLLLCMGEPQLLIDARAHHCVQYLHHCFYMTWQVESYFIWWETKCWESNDRAHWGGCMFCPRTNLLLYCNAPSLAIFKCAFHTYQSSSIPTNVSPSIARYTLKCNVH